MNKRLFNSYDFVITLLNATQDKTNSLELLNR